MNHTSLFSYKFFRYGAAWIILIAGIVCYYIGYFQIDHDSIWREVIIKIGDVLVIGVILGYLSNAAQFLGVFKQDLQDIIFGKEFLKQRKDLTPLWDTVSIQMFKEKFPSIHKDFLKVIRGYFPKDEVSYYNDYEVNITIEWYDQHKGLIKVVDNVSFELIAESKKKFFYPLKTWTRVINENICENKIDKFIVNNQELNLGQCKEYIIGEDKCHEYQIPLEGSNKYTIKYCRTKIYDLNIDFYIGFRAKYIVNRLRVSLDYPEGMEAIFTCRGTQDDFEDVKKTKRCIEKKYKGVILPRQGYIFALRAQPIYKEIEI